MQSLGLTAQHVADAFEVTRALIQYWMHAGGRHQPPADWRQVLAGLAENAAAERVQQAEREAADLTSLARELRAARGTHPRLPAGDELGIEAHGPQAQKARRR